MRVPAPSDPVARDETAFAFAAEYAQAVEDNNGDLSPAEVEALARDQGARLAEIVGGAGDREAPDAVDGGLVPPDGVSTPPAPPKAKKARKRSAKKAAK